MDELALTEQQRSELVTAIQQNGITDLIKPLAKEIFLFDTFIAGTSYVDKNLIDALNADDKLILRREGDNKFDDKAVLVLNKDQKKVGYIPEKDNAVFSRLMDAGKLLTAKVKKIDKKGDFSKIEISIFLTDF